jgi:hypothetical protein
MTDELDLSNITDEQLAQQFPGQDVAALRASLDRADGKNETVSPSADAAPGDQAGSEDNADSNTVEYPEWIPEKYRHGTVDEAMQALAKGHAELESHLGRTGDGQTDESEEPEGDEEEGEGSEEQPTSHFTLADLEAEFVERGELSAETYAAAAKDGWTRAEVDSYIAGQQALAQQLITRVHNMVGGEQAYTDMMSWAQENLSEAQVNAYDEALMGTNQNGVDLAVRGLKSMYESQVGKQPNLQTGD